MFQEHWTSLHQVIRTLPLSDGDSNMKPVGLSVCCESKGRDKDIPQYYGDNQMGGKIQENRSAKTAHIQRAQVLTLISKV